MSETTTPEAGTEVTPEVGEQEQEATLTQADVDRIVKERIARVEAKYSDYNDLKAKADGAKTLEDRVGTLEGELTTTRAEAARNRVAAKFGISTERGPKDEPSDAELFLTGSDEAAMTKIAERIAGRAADTKKNGNVARNEGDTKTTGNTNGDEFEVVSQLFGGSA